MDERQLLRERQSPEVLASGKTQEMKLLIDAEKWTLAVSLSVFLTLSLFLSVLFYKCKTEKGKPRFELNFF